MIKAGQSRPLWSTSVFSIESNVTEFVKQLPDHICHLITDSLYDSKDIIINRNNYVDNSITFSVIVVI